MRNDLLLANGKEINYNLNDALEVLTETEAVMLDMLVSKVKNYTDYKEKQQMEQIENISKITTNNLINLLLKNEANDEFNQTQHVQNKDNVVFIQNIEDLFPLNQQTQTFNINYSEPQPEEIQNLFKYFFNK